MRRRLLRRKGCGLPPTIVRPAPQTTSPRAPQECHAPPSRLQWPAVTHSRPPVALGRWGRGQIARARAFSCLAATASLTCLAVNRTLRKPPSLTPRRLAAASAAFVRSEIISRSCWAITAIMPMVSRLACGMSAKRDCACWRPERGWKPKAAWLGCLLTPSSSQDENAATSGNQAGDSRADDRRRYRDRRKVDVVDEVTITGHATDSPALTGPKLGMLDESKVIVFTQAPVVATHGPPDVVPVVVHSATGPATPLT